MNCKCITVIDKKLEPQGLRLSDKLIGFTINEGEGNLIMEMTCLWPIERLDGKKPRSAEPKTMRMTHCPFCGVKAEKGKQ